MKRSTRVSPEFEPQASAETRARELTKAVQKTMISNELERLRLYQGGDESLSQDWRMLHDDVSDLHYAAFYGDVTSVKRIITDRKMTDKSKIFDDRTEDGPKLLKEVKLCTDEHYGHENYSGFFLDTTPLMMAAQQGHLSVVKYLVGHGYADVDACDSIGLTPLALACSFNHLNVAKYLLLKHAHRNVIESRNYMTPLILASVNNHTEVCKMLVHRHASVFEADRYGRQAIHYAAWNYNRKLVEFLCSHTRVDINVQDRNKNTPMHLLVSDDAIDLRTADDITTGAEMQDIDAVKSHLSKYTDTVVDIKRESRRGTKNIGEEYICLVLMIRMGASLTLRNDKGHTVLHTLCDRLTPVVYSQGFLYIESPTLSQTLLVMLKILIKSGAAIKDVDSLGMSPLTLSVRQHNWLAAKFLSRGSVMRSEVNVEQFKSLSDTVAMYGWGNLVERRSIEKDIEFISSAVMCHHKPCKKLKMAERIMGLFERSQHTKPEINIEY